MNNFKIQNFKKYTVVISVLFSIMSFGAACADDSSSNACSQYQDPAKQANCLSTLNAIAQSKQNLINKYSITTPTKSLLPAAPDYGSSAYNPNQQPAPVTSSAPVVAPSPVTTTVVTTTTPPSTNADKYNMTPWQRLTKRPDTQSTTSVSTSVSTSATQDDHVNIFK